MIACSLTKVNDEKALLSFLDALTTNHGVRVSYLQPCLPQKFDICIEGPDEKLAESDLQRRAARNGWLFRLAPESVFHYPAI